VPTVNRHTRPPVLTDVHRDRSGASIVLSSLPGELLQAQTERPAELAAVPPRQFLPGLGSGFLAATRVRLPRLCQPDPSPSSFRIRRSDCRRGRLPRSTKGPDPIADSAARNRRRYRGILS
jgi:hypothetical protein